MSLVGRLIIGWISICIGNSIFAGMIATAFPNSDGLLHSIIYYGFPYGIAITIILSCIIIFTLLFKSVVERIEKENNKNDEC